MVVVMRKCSRFQILSAHLNIKIIIYSCILQQALFLDNGVPCVAFCSYRMWLTFPEASCLALRRQDNRSSYIFSISVPLVSFLCPYFILCQYTTGYGRRKAIKLSSLVAVLSGWQNESKKSILNSTYYPIFKHLVSQNTAGDS